MALPALISSSPAGLTEDEWQTLVFEVTQGDCILMLGEDAITETVDGSAIPVMTLVGDQLREKIKSKRELPSDWPFSRIAQAYKDEFSGPALLTATGAFIKARKAAPDQALLDLAAMPFKLIINTTPGTEVEQAFRCNNKTPKSEWYNFNGALKELVPEGTTDEPLVYHLYGCVTDLKSLVLSEDDILDFLVHVISKDPPLPNNIRSEFLKKANCFLFLGFGLKHWYLRILLHLRYGIKNPSFALEKFDAIDPVTVERTKSFFQEGHKIRFLDLDLTQFAAELRNRVTKLRSETEPGAEMELPAEAPRAFLCHARENKDYAKDLAEKLHAAGIRTWLDKDDIRGGDAWDAKIENVLKEEVDFCVVVQSKALFEKKEGAYVSNEINWALKRQGSFLETAFIIPVIIDDSEKLKPLDRLQTIDLTKAGGFDKLVQAIRRNDQVRKKRSG